MNSIHSCTVWTCSMCNTLEVCVCCSVQQIMFYTFSFLLFASRFFGICLSILLYVGTQFHNTHTHSHIVDCAENFVFVIGSGSCSWCRLTNATWCATEVVVTIDDNWVNGDKNCIALRIYWPVCASIDWFALVDKRWIDYAKQRRILFFSGSDTQLTQFLNCNWNREMYKIKQCNK